MFCPYCGTESTQGLNYCNRCGGNLAPLAQGGARETRPAVVAPGSAWAAGLTTSAVVIIGIGMIFPITSELTIRGMPATAVVWIAFFVAVAVLACTGMLLRFWSLLFGVGNPGRATTTPPALPGPKATDTRELGDARFDALNPASVPSITEQTTRTLEREVVNRKP
ncbi:MAG: zinc ribbon domain-containing protein [Pyrinomonadaceae bacterium]